MNLPVDDPSTGGMSPISAISSVPTFDGTSTQPAKPSRREADSPAVVVDLSAEALAARSEQQDRDAELNTLSGQLVQARKVEAQAHDEAEEALAIDRGEVLSDDEERYLHDLKSRDQEVRAHEAAHVAAAAGHAGTPQYSTVTGPDGRQYAVAGRVSVDMSPEGSPEATAQKMRTLKRAASAVPTMSGADMRIAAKAARAADKADQTAHQKRAEQGYAQGAALAR